MSFHLQLASVAAKAAEEVRGRYGRGLGCRPNAPDDRDLPAAPLLGSIVHEERVDLSWAVTPDGIRDQSITSACVGFGFARVVAVRARVTGKPLRVYPSEQAIYTVGRQLSDASGPLIDNGTYGRVAAEGMRDYGIVGEDRCPFDPSTINFGVLWDVVRAGSSNRVVDKDGLHYYSALGSTDMKRALTRGLPVAFGLAVDDNFMAYRSGVYQRGGRILGGHMMAAVGYERDHFVVVNSWGLDFGELGYVRIPVELFDDPTVTFDRTVVDIVPGALH